MAVAVAAWGKEVCVWCGGREGGRKNVYITNVKTAAARLRKGPTCSACSEKKHTRAARLATC